MKLLCFVYMYIFVTNFFTIHKKYKNQIINDKKTNFFHKNAVLRFREEKAMKITTVRLKNRMSYIETIVLYTVRIRVIRYAPKKN